MTTYKQTVDWLFKQLPVYQRQGKSAYKKDLTNIKAICKQLGHPENGFKSIHIAGTNGKGSVSHIIASILQQAGYKVGLYTSPHYVDFRERIKVNGNLIAKAQVVDFVKDIKASIDKIQPSFFELTVAMAFDYFAKEAVDIAVIETGLGGRLDSTNIVNPLLSIITNISYDHENMLGDTLPQIAFEKAGIIKPNVPVLIGERQDEVVNVFEQKAEMEGSALFFSEQLCKLCLVEEHGFSNTFCAKINGIETVFKSDLLGDFQVKNLQSAIAGILLLKNLKITSEHIFDGIKNVKKSTRYIGRFQLVNQQPNIVIDAAHNKAGLGHIFNFINKLNCENVVLVIGFVKDKAVDEIVQLLPKNVKCLLTEPKIFRKLPAKSLYKIAETQNRYLPFIEKSEVVFEHAKGLPARYTVVFTGSSFIVADILRQIAD